jgi:hypothetical protein
MVRARLRARLRPRVQLGLRESLSLLQMVSMVAEALVGLSRLWTPILWTSLAPTVPIIRISVVWLQIVLIIECGHTRDQEDT